MAEAPFVRVDHLVVAVRDLAAAEHEYRRLLGREPSTRGTHPALGTMNVVFGLANCYLELLALAPGAPAHPVAAALAAFLTHTAEGIFAIALGSDALDVTARMLRAADVAVGEPAVLDITTPDGRGRRVRLLPIAREHTRGVNVLAVEHLPDAVAVASDTVARDHRSTIALAAARGDERTTVAAVDHVVLFTDDLDGALRLWRDTFGVPARWRHESRDRGTMNVGLRLGGVTLELVAPLGVAAGERDDRVWGVAYAVADCDAAVARLRAEGVAVSDARTGLAPATRVATVKREGVPTLLIAHTR